MKIITRKKALQQILQKYKKGARSVGFVPTMGCLHDGHVSLIRRAREENECVVVSIFVNPLQFGPREDFERYPRARARDYALCKKEKVDIVYAPSARHMYPQPFLTTVSVTALTDCLCGRVREGHFDGVATVVCKLLQHVVPERAYFGKKDYQQLCVIKQMVHDLDLPVTVIGCPTVREHDGIALSSRNRYLSANERVRARVLFHSLKDAKERIRSGERSVKNIIRIMRQMITKAADAVDYVAIRDAKTLAPVKTVRGRVVIATAAYFGRARLIDNMEIAVT